MGLIRNDAVVALNGIIVAARTLAARLRLAADVAGGQGSGDALTRQATDLDHIARQLAEMVQADDPEDFPATPSDEFLMMDATAIRVRLTVTEAVDDLRREWYRDLAESLRQHAPDAPDDAHPLIRTLQEMLPDD